MREPDADELLTIKRRWFLSGAVWSAAGMNVLWIIAWTFGR